MVADGSIQRFACIAQIYVLRGRAQTTEDSAASVRNCEGHPSRFNVVSPEPERWNPFYGGAVLGHIVRHFGENFRECQSKFIRELVGSE
jgi:hypothetical protein